MDQKELAAKLGVHKNTVSSWEIGRTKPDIVLIPAICKELQISLYALFSVEEPKARYTPREDRLIGQYRKLNDQFKSHVDTMVNSLILAIDTVPVPDLYEIKFQPIRLAAGSDAGIRDISEAETLYLYRESLKVLVPSRSMRDTVYAVTKTGKEYKGIVTADHYGRPHPKHAHGTGNIDVWTNSTRRIMDAMIGIYSRVVDEDLYIRRVNISAVDLISEQDIPEEKPEQLDLFTDYEELEQQKEATRAADEKERKIQKTALMLQEKYGKNAVLKGMNLLDGGTTIERNGQIGGHRSGESGFGSMKGAKK